MNALTPAAAARPQKPAQAKPEVKSEDLDVADSPVGRDKMSRLFRYASAVPFIGGFGETGYGIQEVRLGANNKEKRDGKIDITRGSAAQVQSCTTVPMYLARYAHIALVSSRTLAYMGVVGGLAGTVNALFDGGRDIYNGLKEKKAGDPHAKSDITWGSVKLGAGLVGAAGSFMVCPPLLIASGFIFIGAVIGQNPQQIKELPHKIAALPHKLAALPHKIGDAAHHLADKIHHQEDVGEAQP